MHGHKQDKAMDLREECSMIMFKKAAQENLHRALECLLLLSRSCACPCSSLMHKHSRGSSCLDVRGQYVCGHAGSTPSYPFLMDCR